MSTQYFSFLGEFRSADAPEGWQEETVYPEWNEGMKSVVPFGVTWHVYQDGGRRDVDVALSGLEGVQVYALDAPEGIEARVYEYGERAYLLNRARYGDWKEGGWIAWPPKRLGKPAIAGACCQEFDEDVGVQKWYTVP